MLNYLPSFTTFAAGIYTGYKSKDIGIVKSTACNIAAVIALDVAAHMLGISTCKTAFKVGLFATSMILNGIYGKNTKETHLLEEHHLKKLPFNDNDGIVLASLIAGGGSYILGQYGETLAITTGTYSIGSVMSFGLSYWIT